MSGFSEKVISTLGDHNMLSGADAVVCALSGGADSVSMLRVLKSLEEELGVRVSACHLNHGLRGDESDSDELFCRELCRGLDVPLTVRSVNIEELREKHESIEQTARRVRYDFFREVLENTKGTPVLATAHTASDSAETVLFNLTRGTGLDGLCGIPPVRTLGEFSVIRPLIRVSRSEVEDFLRVLGQDFVTDRTNLSDEYSRNRIRLNVIPELAKINQAVVETIFRASENIRADNLFLDEMTNSALEKYRLERGWNASELAKLPEPIKARAVKKILAKGNIAPSSLRIKTAMSLLEKRSARYNPCKDRFFTIRKGVCFTEEKKQVFHGHNERNHTRKKFSDNHHEK